MTLICVFAMKHLLKVTIIFMYVLLEYSSLREHIYNVISKCGKALNVTRSFRGTCPVDEPANLLIF